MALIAMINLRIEAEYTEGAYTADSEEYFLLETVLPVTAIELVGHGAVFRTVCLPVCVEKIEVGTADCHLPDSGYAVPSREGNGGGKSVSVLIENRLCRCLEEILRIVLCNLLTV